MEQYSTGASESKYDIRTFVYKPTPAPYKGGHRYDPKDIEDQSKVGICTAISLTQQAGKALGQKFSADFQYLLQKKYFDNNWDEGSSIFASVKTAYTYGLLPEKEWKHTTMTDRNLGYARYIKKLQAISDKEIQRLLKKAEKYKIKAYASVPVQRDTLANAIDNSEVGLLTRMVVGEEWWTAPIEPLRRAKYPISGHAITNSNYTGGSFRVANTWGSNWADLGTAYFMLKDNPITEAWIVYYTNTTSNVDQQLNKKDSPIKDFIQKIISRFQN